MRTIIKSLIIASALVTGGSAFAGDIGDTTADQVATSTQLAFAAQSSNRVAVQSVATQRSGNTVQIPADPRLTPASTLAMTNSANN